MVLVTLLSVAQIRKSLVPLESLTEVTWAMARGNFHRRVEINSGDEFELLAEAFNNMAERVGRQVNTLTTLSEIDQLILSSSRVEPVVEKVILRINSVVGCDFVGVTVVDPDADDRARTFFGAVGGAIRVDRTLLSARSIGELKAHRHGFVIQNIAVLSGYLNPLRSCGAQSFFVMPVKRKDRLVGIISLGYAGQRFEAAEQFAGTRDFADRLAVALASVEREEQLYKQAHYDPLTGLPNRQLFKDRLTQEVAHCQADERTGALMFIDLDRFKAVNDAEGHSAGDALLKMAGQRLKKCLGPSDTLARLGGDEFTVILAKVDNPRQLSQVADEIVRQLSKPFSIDRIQHYVGASVGITMFPNDGTEVDLLLRNADTAMYRVKDSGRGTHMYFHDEMNIELVARRQTEADLRRALQRDELCLHYQPRVNLATGEISGVEALLRWKHPQRGLLAPKEFIAIAEETGLIVNIGQWVIGAACQQYMTWTASGIQLDYVSANVSVRQFRKSGFVHRVRQVLSEANMPASALELEITESVLADKIDETVLILRELRALGVRIAIDDFGTGYSSLSYLKRLEFDTLKIDQSFTKELVDDAASRAITRAIIAMAHTLNKNIVAEGIETQAQLEMLEREGCQLGQGFAFSKPVSADGLLDLLTRPRHTKSA